MKGNNKQFAKFLKSEYYDDYLEPLEDYIQITLQKLSKPLSCPSANQPNSSQTFQKDQPDSLSSKAQKINLIKNVVEELTLQLGQDSQLCTSYLHTIETIQTKTVLEAYKDLYNKFETLPELFLSITPEKIIYLWQINNKCPIRSSKKKQLAVDIARKNVSGTSEHLSFLLLAKIIPEKDEEILEANLIGDSLLYVKSKQGDHRLAIRFYKIENFNSTARINPFRQEVLANQYYSYTIIIEGSKNKDIETLNNLNICLWKKDNAGEKEKFLHKRSCNSTSSLFKEYGSNFNVMHKGTNNEILILDLDTGTVIVWKNDELVVLFNIDMRVDIVERIKDGIFLVDVEENAYEIDLNTFPNIKMQKKKNLLRQTSKNKINEWKNLATNREKWAIFLKEGHTENSNNDCMLVYDVPVSLVNPYFEEHAEEKNKTRVKKIEIKNDRLKHSKNDFNTIQGKNDLLKEIRADISSKIKEAKYLEKKKGEKEEKDSVSIESSYSDFVSKETLRLYSEIKAEKKMLAKEREKGKINKKNRKSEKNEF